MGTVRTFCAHHGKGLSLALVLLCALTYAFGVERSEFESKSIIPPPKGWPHLPDKLASSMERVTLDDLPEELAQGHEDPSKKLERVLIEVEKASTKQGNDVTVAQELPQPPFVVELMPVSPQKTPPEPLLQWVDPLTPPVLPKEAPPLHVVPVAPPTARMPSTPFEIVLPLPDAARPREPLPMFDNQGKPRVGLVEEEPQEAPVEQRLAFIRDSLKPPLFVQPPEEIKRQLDDRPAPQAEPRKYSLREVAATRPDVADRTVDPIATIRITTEPEIVPAKKQTDEPPGVLPSLLPVRADGCLTCGRNGKHGGHGRGRGRCATCGSGQCVPGQERKAPCESNTLLGGFFCDLYECVCCPDPCYDPQWIPQADAAFFVDAARPVSQMRIGWEAGRNMRLPDRSEYFWARADGSGKGPRIAGNAAERSLSYDDLVVYTETAAGGFSAIVNFPYRNLSPDRADHASGFIDMTVGTKSLLFDCEMLQLSFQFLTYIPTGNFTTGLGTGHLSLEPSILFTLKLTPSTYVQGQIAEWIPLGGDPAYAGSILRTHASINQVIYRVTQDVPVIGTFEMSTYSFQDGAYTDPVNGPLQRSNGTTYAYVGPGLRMFICDRMDFGAGAQFAVTPDHFAQTVVRMMFRYRY